MAKHVTQVGECLCEKSGTHAKGETVTFKAEIGFRELAAANWALHLWREVEGITETPTILARLSEFYLLQFIETWTVRDKKGKPLPANPANVRRLVLSRPLVALALSDFADSIYSETVFLPLVSKGATSSPPGTTDEASTSADSPSSEGSSPETPSSPPSPTRSRRSSTSTTPTDAIAATA